MAAAPDPGGHHLVGAGGRGRGGAGRHLLLLRRRSRHAQLERHRRLSPGADHQGARPRRQPHRRDRLHPPHRGALREDPQDHDPGPAGRGGRRLLRARGRGLQRHGARLRRKRPSAQVRPGRLDHHPAGGQAALAHAGKEHAAQGAGDHPGAPVVAALFQGRRAGHLPQPDVLRPRPLRGGRGRALLLRQVHRRRRRGRGGTAGRAGAVARAALAVQTSGRGQEAPDLRSGADGQAGIHL